MNFLLFADASAKAVDPLAVDYITMGVTLIVFVALLAILYFTAWGPIMKGLAKREELISSARDEAVQAKASAEDAQKKLTAEFAAAQDKIRAMMDEARRDADALKASEKAVGIKEAQAERERAKHEIEVAKDQAIAELHTQAVKLAALMSSKAVKRTVTEADHLRLVDEALAELNTTVTKA
jgi:F-type H+-transporting ATPase subunit b